MSNTEIVEIMTDLIVEEVHSAEDLEINEAQTGEIKGYSIISVQRFCEGLKICTSLGIPHDDPGRAISGLNRMSFKECASRAVDSMRNNIELCILKKSG